MSKSRARGFLLVSVLSAWLLSGCITNLAPVRPLPREALASVTEVAVAVGADGLKHYAWTECSGEDDSLTCVLVYSRVSLGVVIYSHGFVVPIGTVARYPDVAVSNNGDAYVVRSECTASALTDCVDYWSMFPADPDNVQIDTNLLHTSALDSKGPPLVEARNDDVYAAYYIEVGGNPRLRYRQLAGGARTGQIDASPLPQVDASLAIDAAGDLHAVWVRASLSDTVAYSNNKGAVNDFNAATTFESGMSNFVSRPDIALDSTDRAYIAYTVDNGVSDSIKVRCLDTAVNCFRGVQTLLVPQVDGPWEVFRNANLELLDLQPNLVFSARNTTAIHNEVWWYRPPSTGANTPPQQVTQTANEIEGEPLIVKEHSTSGDVAVLGWRIYIPPAPLTGPEAPAVGAGLCWGDVSFTFTLSTVHQLFEDHGTCNNDGFDMAANGPWVAGVWVDEESAQLATHAAWTAFNAYGVKLPQVMR